MYLLVPIIFGYYPIGIVQIIILTLCLIFLVLLLKNIFTNNNKVKLVEYLPDSLLVLGYFGFKIIKSAVKISEFVGVLASTSITKIPKLINKPKTLYYTITTYEDRDAYNYYVKQNIKIYSSSSRSSGSLLSNANVISRFRERSSSVNNNL